MLQAANREIEDAAGTADEARRRRRELRAALSEAEALSAELEEVLLGGAHRVPRALFVRIRRFADRHDWSPLRRDGTPVATLDALFDLQEHLQTSFVRRQAAREGSPGGVGGRIAGDARRVTGVTPPVTPDVPELDPRRSRRTGDVGDLTAAG